MATQLIGGILNQILGPRLVVGASLGLSAIATAFVPLVAELASFWAVFFVRVFLGALSVCLNSVRICKQLIEQFIHGFIFG